MPAVQIAGTTRPQWWPGADFRDAIEAAEVGDDAGQGGANDGLVEGGEQEGEEQAADGQREPARVTQSLPF